MTKQTTVRTRMAPSPTGEFHVGALHTLLRNLAFARKNSGQFIIRIEDTDRQRLVKGATQKILEVIKKFGLDWDEGPDIGGPYAPYTQSKRLKIYQDHVKQLINQDHAYYCFCTKERLEEMRKQQQLNKQIPKYDRTCLKLDEEQVKQKLRAKTPHVIRLKMPDNQQISFTDLIRGVITFNSNDIDDQVIMKSDGYPTYHLAVVIDDHLMKISHVIRGEEWISSTPKHILLYQAYGWEPPIYAHTPVFLNPSGKGKMSKRNLAVSAQSYLDQGYLPEAVLNFLMIMGWAPKDKQEILSLDDFFHQFTLENISSKSVVFDTAKLDWLNGIYIRRLTDQQLINKLIPFIPSDFPSDKLSAVLPLIKDRLIKLSDFTPLTDFFYQKISLDSQLLVKKTTPTLALTQLQETIHSLSQLPDWNLAPIEASIRKIQEANHWAKSQYFMLIRLAATGRSATPPLFETIQIIGRDLTIKRLKYAHKLITK